MGYDLKPTFQGKGIMSEALNSIVEYGFNELKLERIEAFTNKQNEHSVKLLERNGFKVNALRKDKNNALNLIFEIETAH